MLEIIIALVERVAWELVERITRRSTASLAVEPKIRLGSDTWNPSFVDQLAQAIITILPQNHPKIVTGSSHHL